MLTIVMNLLAVILRLVSSVFLPLKPCENDTYRISKGYRGTGLAERAGPVLATVVELLTVVGLTVLVVFEDDCRVRVVVRWYNRIA